MSQQNGAPKLPATAQQPAARPYRRFIVPSLHRRFTNAAVLSLALCSVEALWMGSPYSFWQILGMSSIRTLLLFVSILPIYILRVANLHVGTRTTPSDLQTLWHFLLGFNAARALLWYSFSAVFFCEVYIWSSSRDARLSILDPGKPYERSRLNERPIFLRTMFLCLAAAQAFVHLYRDYDRASIPVLKPKTDMDSLKQKSQRAFWVPMIELRQNLFAIVRRSFFWAFVTTFVTPVVYWMFIRHTVWSWTYAFAKHVFDLPRASSPPTFPTLVVDLLGRFLLEGFLLKLSWEIANSAFDSYLSLEPLKQGRLLTDESQDPNGSLLNGLKTNRPIPRSFAFWELSIVAEYMSERRKNVYSEISRQGGSTWSQILTVCLGELHAVVKRIQTFQSPPGVVPQDKQTIHSLPKIAEPVKQDNIFKNNPPPPSKKPAGTTQSPRTDKLLTSSATKLLTYTADAALSKHHQQTLSKDGVQSTLEAAAVALLHYPVGAPFRHTFARRARSVVFTSPHSNLGTLVDAITAVARLAVHSKKEDRLGSVYRDVPNIVRTFASTHNAVEAFLAALPVHWTDVKFGAGPGARRVADVEIVLAALREGLRELVNEFGEYSDDMGLSAAELRLAKEVVAKGAAVEQTQRVSAG